MCTITDYSYTLHHKIYVHASCFVVFCHLAPLNFTDIQQDNFADTGSILWLSQCPLNNDEVYRFVDVSNLRRIPNMKYSKTQHNPVYIY